MAEAAFREALAYVKSGPRLDTSNEQKLRFYALYKQVSSGDCKGKRPGRFDFVKRAKYDAWKKCAGMSREAAQRAYVAHLRSLAPKWAPEGGSGAKPRAKPRAKPAAATRAAAAGAVGGLPVFTDLVVALRGGVLSVRINRPRKFNALRIHTYRELIAALKFAGADKRVKVVVLTGTGKFFSSGNDLTNFTSGVGGDLKAALVMAKNLCRDYVNAFLRCPKIVIAAVNGPAVGISVTILALCDFVYASDTATFHTPFMSLAQSPEACSSYTFPALMGLQRANELLLLGRKFSAKDMHTGGLLNAVFPKAQLDAEVGKVAATIAGYAPGALVDGKKLLRRINRAELEKINAHECEVLAQRWTSKEAMDAIMKFMARSRRRSRM